MKFDVTVIVPCYNCADTVKETFNSIMKQTVKPQCIFFINDGSTDNTLNILRQLKNENPYIVNIISQQNRGVSSARNKGILNAKTEWVAFCDSDDFWIENKLEIVCKVLEQHSDLDFIAHGYYEEYNGIQKRNCQEKFKENSIYLTNYHRNFIQTSTVLIKKRLLESTGLFKEELKVAEDFDLWLTCLAKGKPLYIQKELSVYRVNREDNLSSNEMRMYRSTLHVLLFHADELLYFMNGRRAYQIVTLRILRLAFAEFLFQLRHLHIFYAFVALKFGVNYFIKLSKKKEKFYV